MKGIATDFFLCLPVICLLVRPGIFYAKLGIFILQFWGFLAYKKQTGHYVKCVGLTPIVFPMKTVLCETKFTNCLWALIGFLTSPNA